MYSCHLISYLLRHQFPSDLTPLLFTSIQLYCIFRILFRTGALKLIGHLEELLSLEKKWQTMRYTTTPLLRQYNENTDLYLGNLTRYCFKAPVASGMLSTSRTFISQKCSRNFSTSLISSSSVFIAMISFKI